MRLEVIRDLPKKQVNFKNIFQDAIIAEMNIYNQAHLEIDTPLVLTRIVHPKTQHEIGVQFKLEGEIKGNIYCYLDTFNKDVTEKEKNFFQLLFVESMNILIGRILTNIEENDDLIAILSNPSFLNLKEQQQVEFNKGSIDHEILAIGYKLIATQNEYDCRLIFNLDKSN